MLQSDARRHVMAAMECGDQPRAETLLREYAYVYPDAGAQLYDEVREAYPEADI